MSTLTLNAGPIDCPCGYPRIDSGDSRRGLNDIDVWCAALDEPSADAVERLASLLSPDERVRASGFHFERDRRRYVVGRGILRSLLGDYLGGGQRKRLALLNAYLEDRPFYLFDEWASDQDPLFKEIFYTQLLPDLKARNKTALIITHDDRYFHLADRIVKLDYGRMETRHGAGQGGQARYPDILDGEAVRAEVTDAKPAFSRATVE